MIKLVISDVHAHWLHLKKLVESFGVKVDNNGNILYFPEGLVIYNLGDIVDRGEYPVECLHFFYQGLELGKVFSVMGNHDSKLYRHLKGNKIELWEEQLSTVELIKGHEDWILEFYSKLPYSIILPEVNLVHGQYSPNGEPKRYMFARSVKTENHQDNKILPEDRYKWFEHYDGKYGWSLCGHFGENTVYFGNKCACIDSAVFRTGVLSGVYWEDEGIDNLKLIEVTL